ncbi:MAG: trehalose-phosphatase [Dehalococcoidia bacterium]|nr:trehalose-phosphatase [Dehalococcoidia bacterium]
MAVALASPVRVRELIDHAPAGVFLDLDGTLSRIAPTPFEATVSERAVAALERLAARVARLTFISGRTPADAASMVGLLGPNIAYVGNHGLSLLLDGKDQTPPEALAFVETVDRLTDELSDLLDIPGILFEPRTPVLSIHYRLAADHDAAREAILHRIAESPEAGVLTLQEGRRVIELRPPLLINKGSTLQQLAQDWGLRAVLMAGDDITDISAFEALRYLREQEGLHTISIAVLGQDTDPSVAAAADYTLDGVDAVEDLLEQI